MSIYISLSCKSSELAVPEKAGHSSLTDVSDFQLQMLQINQARSFAVAQLKDELFLLCLITPANGELQIKRRCYSFLDTEKYKS